MARLDLTRESAALAAELEREAPELAALSSDARASAIETWRGRMVNEHASARVFAGLIPQLMRAELDAGRQAEVAEMIADELRHARQCAAVVAALGGAPIGELPALSDVPAHADAEPLEGLLRNIISVSCMSETVAVALISAERMNTGPAALKRVLGDILADEVQHARFGWRLLEELAPRLPAAMKRRLGVYLVTAFAHLREHELAHLPARPAPSRAAEAVGVCDGHEARRLFLDTVRDVIIPGLEDHGLPAAAAWEASLAA
ncbi:MAG: ferritin-like domain-containing protein [Myxococcales bacterium]|nr:ferritin-like domain-containing protein [Myxococcales bacterium]